MELPKNITQIGEVGKDSKVYAEDYVISYMKQLNRAAQDKVTAVALYGRRSEENGVVYYFLYGACKLTLLQREVRHLSQAQNQEIERLRRKYFPEYVFLGYRLLDGEMIEGFHICEQDICRYIGGYAQFYEKNDPMLSYMLEVRGGAQPEQVNQEKYEEVKKRQEERRAASERPAERRERDSSARERAASRRSQDAKKEFPPQKVERMRFTAASVFVLLCLVGFVMLQRDADSDRTADLQETAKKWVDGVLEQQLPDAPEAIPASGTVASKDVLVMEDKLEQALLEENQAGQEAAEKQEETPATEAWQEPASETQPADTTELPAQTQPADEESDAQQAEPASGPAVAQETAPAAKQEAVAYVIQTGDTLIAISKRQYGSEARVPDICVLNKISNPDDIKEGQVILLPK